jgi:hypothetical protein
MQNWIQTSTRVIIPFNKDTYPNTGFIYSTNPIIRGNVDRGHLG